MPKNVENTWFFRFSRNFAISLFRKTKFKTRSFALIGFRCEFSLIGFQIIASQIDFIQDILKMQQSLPCFSGLTISLLGLTK